MKKLVLGVLIGLMCGGGAIAIADTAGNNEAKGNIESYLQETYGADWANTLYGINGEQWDDILEDELATKFGKKYDKVIDRIIDLKEKEAGLDKLDNDDDPYDDDTDDDLTDDDDLYDDDDLTDDDDLNDNDDLSDDDTDDDDNTYDDLNDDDHDDIDDMD